MQMLLSIPKEQAITPMLKPLSTHLAEQVAQVV